MANRREFLTHGTAFVAGTVAVGPAGAAARGGIQTATVLNGRGAPRRTLGHVGDFYINTRAHTIYGPKRTHGWGRATSLVGKAGPQGPMGYAVLHGSGPPSRSLGEDNDFYIDTASAQLYGPKEGGVWGAAVSLGAPPVAGVLSELYEATHPTFFDDCAGQRPGPLGNATSGQPWEGIGSDPPAYVAGVSYPALTYGTAPSGAAEFFATATLPAPVLAAGGRFRIRDSSPASTNGNVIIGSWDGTTNHVPVHIVMTRYEWYVSYVSGGTQVSVAPDLRSGSAPYPYLTEPLMADGATIYEVWFARDIPNSRVYVRLPDGVVICATDPHFGSLGPLAHKPFFEGQTTASTDAIFEWVEAWASTSVPLNLTLRP
jgi:hypothetical protein